MSEFGNSDENPNAETKTYVFVVRVPSSMENIPPSVLADLFGNGMFGNGMFAKTVPFDLEGETKEKKAFKPRWYVILHDDSVHTYDYVIKMLCDLFEMTPDKAKNHAIEVDTKDFTILARLSKEEALEKQLAIHKYGGDALLKSEDPMKATVEPVDD